MTKYAALLRGIGPTNPNMRNDKLRGVFEDLGFRNVKTVISSGNVLFEAPSTNVAALEAKVAKALPARLGFTSTTIIRSREQLQHLVDRQPFKGIEHTQHTYLTVTFLKHPGQAKLELSGSKDKAYKVLHIYDQEVCSVVDLTNAKAPQLMSWLEKQLGKEITTRTWKTVLRILNKMD